MRQKKNLKEVKAAAAANLLLVQQQARVNAGPLGVIMMQGETYIVILPTASLRPCVLVPSSSSAAPTSRTPRSGSEALSSTTPPFVLQTAEQFGRGTSRLGLDSEETSQEITSSQPFSTAPPSIDLNVTPPVA